MVIVLGVLFIPWTMRAMTPKETSIYKGIEQYAPDFLEEEEKEKQLEAAERNRPKARGLADFLEHSRVISLLVVAGGATYLISELIRNGPRMDLNLFNFVFLMLGILLHGTPIRYIRAIQSAIGGTSGIVLQFPFYAGIAGMMAGSGLTVMITEALVAIATPQSFPVINWFATGIVNLFIPSGGAQWVATGEILSTAAVELGVPANKLIISYGAGDMWTNMFQPFWALALLGIMKLRARDMMGYCIVLGTLAIPVFALALFFLP
jgi:short-chain fatty acids transporter